MSSSSATMTITIESEEIPSFPLEPKKSKPHISVREIGPQVDLEMSPLPSGVQAPVAGYSTSSQLIQVGYIPEIRTQLMIRLKSRQFGIHTETDSASWQHA